MANEKDLIDKGYTPNNDGTWGKEGSSDKYLVLKGDTTGNVLIKNASRDDVYQEPDKK